MTSPTFTTNGVHHEADEAIDTLYSWWPGPSPMTAPPCPEAVFSLTLKGTIDGVEALLTARGMTAAEFTRNLQAIRGILDAKPQAKAPVEASGTVVGWCTKHALQMTQATKDGRSWWSHRTADGWCKGR